MTSVNSFTFQILCSLRCVTSASLASVCLARKENHFLYSKYMSQGSLKCRTWGKRLIEYILTFSYHPEVKCGQRKRLSCGDIASVFAGRPISRTTSRTATRARSGLTCPIGPPRLALAAGMLVHG